MSIKSFTWKEFQKYSFLAKEGLLCFPTLSKQLEKRTVTCVEYFPMY